MSTPIYARVLQDNLVHQMWLVEAPAINPLCSRFLVTIAVDLSCQVETLDLFVFILWVQITKGWRNHIPLRSRIESLEHFQDLV